MTSRELIKPETVDAWAKKQTGAKSGWLNEWRCTGCGHIFRQVFDHNRVLLAEF